MSRAVVLFIAAIALNPVAAAPTPTPNQPFWTTVLLQDLTWQPECITDRNCQDMTFSIVMESGGVHKQSSWNLNVVTKTPDKAEMTSYWRDSVYHNISLQSLLTATDVFFNVPRPCDQTGPLRTFASSGRASAALATAGNTPDETRTVALVGKCFQAVAEIRLYKTRCPWCALATEPQNIAFQASAVTIDQLVQQPWFMFGALLCLTVCLVGIALGSYCLHKAYQVHKYNEQYNSSSVFETFATMRSRPAANNFPVPPVLRPPTLPRIPKHHEDLYMYPQYETLTTHSQHPKAAIAYDSAVESGCSETGESPNGSFSEPKTSEQTNL